MEFRRVRRLRGGGRRKEFEQHRKYAKRVRYIHTPHPLGFPSGNRVRGFGVIKTDPKEPYLDMWYKP